MTKFTFTDRLSYLAWVRAWKENYAISTAKIRNLKRLHYWAQRRGTHNSHSPDRLTVLEMLEKSCTNELEMQTVKALFEAYGLKCNAYWLMIDAKAHARGLMQQRMEAKAHSKMLREQAKQGQPAAV